MSKLYIDEIAAIEAQSFSTPWSAEAFYGELRNPLAVYGVALVEDRVAGYAGLHHVLDEGHITNIAVTPELRRRGIGAKLMEWMLAYARENSLAFLTLEVRRTNEAAIAFYRRYGFIIRGCRARYYTRPDEDALIMTLEFPRQPRP